MLPTCYRSFYVNLTLFRLIAEKINKNERKSKSTIEVISQGSEEMPFWRALNVHSASDVTPIKVSINRIIR